MISRLSKWANENPALATFLVLGFLLLVVVGPPLGSVYYSQQKSEEATNELTEQNERFIDYQVSSKVESCESANNSRSALLSVLDRAANPPDTGVAGVRLTIGPEYEALDAGTQAYLQWLEKEIARQPDGSENLKEIAADLRKTNPLDVDCKKVGRTLRKELEK